VCGTDVTCVHHCPAVGQVCIIYAWPDGTVPQCEQLRLEFEDIFQNVENGDVQNFILQDNVNVVRFVHECMAVFDAMQAEQPHQAEGQNL